MLFDDEKRHAVALPAATPDGKPATIAFLIKHLCENVMKDTRKELFVLDDHMYVPTHDSIGSPVPSYPHALHRSARGVDAALCPVSGHRDKGVRPERGGTGQDSALEYPAGP